jgi:hypothetical protein
MKIQRIDIVVPLAGILISSPNIAAKIHDEMTTMSSGKSLLQVWLTDLNIKLKLCIVKVTNVEIAWRLFPTLLYKIWPLFLCLQS